MIILDTMVISEPIRPKPDMSVMQWLDCLEVEVLYLTAVTIAELFFGIAQQPDGKKRRHLQTSIVRLVEKRIGDRVLSFDHAAAREYATLVMGARKKGHVVSFPDAQIASIAKYHGYAVATRDEAPFKAMGVDVINPWRDTI